MPKEKAVAQPHLFTFPPFPPTPPGVAIVPFKNFKGYGIQKHSVDGEVEVDGLGIPTVELRVKHSTDVCKSNAKRKPKQKANAGAAATNRKEWWEVWAEGESQRTSYTYNPNMSAADRFQECAHDFRKSRTWPLQSTGISALWDQFRLFSGLLTNVPVWRKVDANKLRADAYEQDDDDDDSSFSDDDTSHKGNTQARSNNPLPRPPYANYGKKPVKVSNDQDIQNLLEDANTLKDDKLQTFLNDPETSMKAFLSSYMRDQGLIWSPRNLVNVPQLVSFFLNFAIRNRALPELERDLRKAVEVIEIAKKELPLTAEIGKALPGEFSKGCEALWGRLSRGLDLDMEEIKIKVEPLANSKRGTDSHDSDTKRHKLDPSQAKHEEFLPQLLTPSNIEFRKEVIEDNVGDDVNLKVDADDWSTGGWGTSGWDEGGTSGNWGVADNNPDSWGAEDPPDASGWENYSNPLLTIMGPTALPNTHTTGVVEWSMRRIKAVTLPPWSRPQTFQSSESGEPDAQAIENELEMRCAKMVLEPWLNWDVAYEQDLCKPQILPKSRGAVVTPDQTVQIDTVTGAKKAHDMTTDNITVLVPPLAVPCLHVGMGLGATWVELAREKQPGGQDVANSGKKKNKKRQKKIPEKYWYMEQLMAILPSYYT